MIRDTYAGDQGLCSAGAEDSLPESPPACFTISAESSPDALLRIAACFLAINSCPDSFTFHRTPSDDFHGKVFTHGVSDFKIDMVRRKLLQLTCVLDVSVSTDAPRTDD